MLSNQSPLRAQGSVHPGLRGGMRRDAKARKLAWPPPPLCLLLAEG